MNRLAKRGGLAVMAGLTIAVCLILGLQAWHNRRTRNATVPEHIPILMYHDVGDATNDLWTIPTADFISQMQYLKTNGYVTILPADVAASVRSGNPLPARPVILTFDDGYAGIRTVVEPVLRSNGFRAISYLITGATAGDASHRGQHEGRDTLVWPEIRQLASRGTVVFGGHSHHHVRLNTATNPGLEIRTCYQELAEKGGILADSFCYPFGLASSSLAGIVQRIGFTTAVTADERLAGGGLTPLFRLPRLWVRGGKHAFSVEQFRLEAGGRHVTCVLRHTGIPVPFVPRLVWAGAGPPDGWDKTGAGDDPVRRCEWVLPASCSPGTALSFEVWDYNRFFPLFRCALP
jgi:peptidoglycan/xylan/chitin deacetylase (PgdA/CDA1 family)